MAKVKLTMETIRQQCPLLSEILERGQTGLDEYDKVLAELEAMIELEIKKSLKHSRALQAAQGGRR